MIFSQHRVSQLSLLTFFHKSTNNHPLLLLHTTYTDTNWHLMIVLLHTLITPRVIIINIFTVLWILGNGVVWSRRIPESKVSEGGRAGPGTPGPQQTDYNTCFTLTLDSWCTFRPKNVGHLYSSPVLCLMSKFMVLLTVVTYCIL